MKVRGNTAHQRPNILVFLTDDHPQWAVGCYGNRDLATPSIDYLAQNGVRMENAFTPTPVCSPARASFFTGKIPSAHGIHDIIQEIDDFGARHPALQGQRTLAGFLKQEGYSTGLVGKWHCGHRSAGKSPGFDEWYIVDKGTNAVFGHQCFHLGDGTMDDRHGHQAVFITDRAISFLRQLNGDEPFFLCVGYTNTHTPHGGEPERHVTRYRNCAFQDAPSEHPAACHGHVRFPPPDDRGMRREQLAQHYAAVSMIDEQVGRLLDELDNLGKNENTLIIYTADHGQNVGRHGIWTKGNATIPQNFLEESIRVPCILHWPMVLDGDQVRPEFVDHCDLFATILDAAGARHPTVEDDIPRPGRSLLPILKKGSGARSWRDAQFCEYGNARMIRTAGEKLILRYEGPNGRYPDEFYDLSGDPRETTNQIKEVAKQGRVGELTDRLNAYFAEYEDPVRSGKDIRKQPPSTTKSPWDAPPWDILGREDRAMGPGYQTKRKKHTAKPRK